MIKKLKTHRSHEDGALFEENVRVDAALHGFDSKYNEVLHRADATPAPPDPDATPGPSVLDTVKGWLGVAKDTVDLYKDVKGTPGQTPTGIGANKGAIPAKAKGISPMGWVGIIGGVLVVGGVIWMVTSKKKK